MTDTRHPKKDATRPLSSPPVIEDDRRHGVSCSPSRCIGANALRRMRGVYDARVGAGIMYLLRRDGWHRYELEPNTKAAVKAYDDNNEPMPEGFVLHFIPPKESLGSRSGEKPGSDFRSGANTSVSTRRPSHRHINVEPTT